MPRCFLAKKSNNEVQHPTYFPTSSTADEGEKRVSNSCHGEAAAPPVAALKEGSASCDSGLSESGSSCNEDMEKAELEVTIKCEVEDEDTPNEDYKATFPASVSSSAKHILKETATSTTDDNLTRRPMCI